MIQELGRRRPILLWYMSQDVSARAFDVAVEAGVGAFSTSPVAVSVGMRPSSMTTVLSESLFDAASKASIIACWYAVEPRLLIAVLAWSSAKACAGSNLLAVFAEPLVEGLAPLITAQITHRMPPLSISCHSCSPVLQTGVDSGTAVDVESEHRSAKPWKYACIL